MRRWKFIRSNLPIDMKIAVKNASSFFKRHYRVLRTDAENMFEPANFASDKLG